MKKKYFPMNENNETEAVEVVEEKEESKVKGFIKNNWKKFAVGAGVVLAGIGGYVLGSNTGNEDDLDLVTDFAEETEETSEE